MTTPTPVSVDSTGAFMAEAVALQVFSTLVDAAPTPSIDLLKSLLAQDPSVAGKDDAGKTLTLLTSLSEHIEAGKSCAQTWRNDILGPVHDLATGIQSYNITFQNMMATVLSAATPTTQQDANTLYNLLNKELGYLQTIGSKNRTQLSSLQNQLEALDSTVSALLASFTADKTALATALNADQGLLASIEGTITDLNKQISTDVGLLAGGAAALAVGVALIVGGALITAGTVGGGTALGATLIVGGVVCVAGGITMEVLGSKLSGLRDQLSAATSELSFLQGLVTFFAGYSPHLTSLAASSKQAKVHAADVATTFAGLETDLAKVQDDITSALGTFSGATPPPLATLVANLTALKGQLNTIAGSWATAAEPLTDLTSVLDGVSTATPLPAQVSL